MAGPPSADFDRGRRIGKYEILTRLSVGGMAELYLAYLPGPGGFKKFVALKQILPDVKADDTFVKMFLDEARITAAFNHANIGQVFDLGEEPQTGELYLAMEFIAGQNLEQTMKRAAKLSVPIPVGFAARVVRDACLGLTYAHTFKDPTGQPMAVVHRDVSPKNVMITYTGQVKVIDFGIAKAKGRLNRTQVGIVKGTSGYMSPEQVRNEALDGRTDLFAAGVMLHELLCGQRLFTGATDAQMMIRIVEEAAVDPSSVNPHCPQALSQVVLKLLEKDRGARFGSGKEAARAIEQACPELFEDEQVAEVMVQLFDDKIATTRALLESANEGDVEHLTQAVQGLSSHEDLEAVRSRATPNPRAGVRNAASSQRLPKVSTGQNRAAKPSTGLTPKVNKPSRASLPPVESPEDTLPPAPAPARRSSMKLKAVAPTPPNPPREAARKAPPPQGAAEKKGGGIGGLLAILVVLASFAGLGWAVAFGPLHERAQALLKAETDEPVVDTTTHPIDASKSPKGQKPAWLLEKERADAQAAEEKARLKDLEDAANDPERQKLLQDIQAQLQQLNALEEEQRQLKIDAKAGKATGEANSHKIEDLQKQIDDLKHALTDKQKAVPRKAVPAEGANPDDVQVVRDSATAKKADIGFLSLRTINPPSSAVSFEGNSFGSTPLAKVPFEVGVHRLQLVDGDGKVRLLSVNIEAGKTLSLPAVDVSSLPLAP